MSRRFGYVLAGIFAVVVLAGCSGGSGRPQAVASHHAVALSSAVASPSTAASSSAAGCTDVASDFNGDGWPDAVAMTTRTINIWYGTSHGFAATPSLVIRNTDMGVATIEEDYLQGPLGTYDPGFLNGDCYADLLVTLYGLRPADEGVIVLYGGPHGLRASDHSHIAATAIERKPKANAGWGSIAVADFNADGIDDVAIGDAIGSAWGDEEGVPLGDGAVMILYGGRHGLSTAGEQTFTENSPGVVGTANLGNSFGRDLAAGDFNGDGHADLAIETTRPVGNGMYGDHITLLNGTAHGLTGQGSRALTLATIGQSQDADAIGFYIRASGDFNGDRYSDLLVDLARSDQYKTGSIELVVYGSATGITAGGMTTVRHTTPGLPAHTGLGFATVVQTGDFNHDGITDVAFGESSLNVDGINGAGAAVVVYGSRLGLSTAGSVMLIAPSDDAGGGFAMTLDAVPATANTAADLMATTMHYGDPNAPNGVSEPEVLFTGGSTGLAQSRVTELQPAV